MHKKVSSFIKTILLYTTICNLEDVEDPVFLKIMLSDFQC